MPRRAQLLYRLQKVDNQLAQKKRRYRQVEARLGESEPLRRARAELKEAREHLARCQATLRDLELQVAGVVEKQQASEKLLYSGRVKNPRELSDLQKEIEYLKRRQAELEDRQLEAMVEVEQATTRLGIASEQYVVVESSWRAENAELGAEYDSLRRELAHLLAQRKGLLRHISETDLAEYNAIRRLRQGVAVVAVRDGACQVCHVSVPRRDLERARQTDELFHCSGCDRILYVPEE